MIFMYCTKCGTKNEDGTKFCTSCGANVDGKTGAHIQITAVVLDAKWSVSRLWQGRIGRWRYFTGSFLPLLGIFILVSIWGVVRLLQSTISVSGGGSSTTDTIALLGTFLNAVIGLLITICIIAFFLFHLLLAIRRCHDLGYTGWLSLLAYIPYIGIIPALFFLFMKGEETSNVYGDPPKSRTFLAEIFNY